MLSNYPLFFGDGLLTNVLLISEYLKFFKISSLSHFEFNSIVAREHTLYSWNIFKRVERNFSF